jgi:hypothetical protein
MSLQNIQNLIASLENNILSTLNDGMGEGNVIFFLRTQLEDAKNCAWTRKELSEHLLSDNDDFEEEMLNLTDFQRNKVREIQHAIINYFGE